MEAKLEGAAFAGARKLANGGVVFDCRDEKTAQWIKESEHMRQFISALGGTCVFRPRRQELLVERVDVETRVEDAGTWRVVEKESGLGEGEIAGARWLKPQHQCSSTQRVAHLRVDFASSESANHAIDNGVFIQGKHHRVRKMEEEPRRCMKCQQYGGHLARDCKAPEDVCARCAANHRTADCPVTDSGTFKCSNCKVSGHSAADRACPFFWNEQQKKRARDPNAGYCYFPTADPKTW
ncbi:hypothetical protein B0H13DRAFT_1602028, partial [Mycena leptocephala]